MTRLLDVFDIFFNLSSFGKTQTNGSAHITTVYKRHEIKCVALWNKANHSQLIVCITWINPNIRFLPDQLFSEGERPAVLVQVQLVFVRVKYEASDLL